MNRKLQKILLTLTLFQGLFFFVCILFYVLNGKIGDVKDSEKHFIGSSEGRSVNNVFRKNKTSNDTVASNGTVARTGDCKEIRFLQELVDENAWLPVDNRKTMFVFSAYYIKHRAKVFIIGAKQTEAVDGVCQFWYWSPDTGQFLVKERHVYTRLPREGHGKIFTSTIFECPLPSSDMPSYISLGTKSCETPLNMVRVRNASKPDMYKHKFAVCLSPLYFKYGRAYELVEWIELNRILGANKFIVYNISTAINTEQVLAYYSKRGLTEVVQWRLPMTVSSSPKIKIKNEIHYFGQSAALNDCLFRSKHDSEFAVNEDLDEFIIPHGSEMFNWTDIIKHVGEDESVYLVRSTYFRKEWENTLEDFPGRDIVEQYKIITLQKFEHERRIFSPKQRSKYIARTATVDYLLTHEVAGAKNTVVPTEIALVHHYRNWFNQKDRVGQVKDETVKQKFGKNLIKRVHNIWKDLAGVKLDIPLEENVNNETNV